jgi:F-type H+-transporting ATPase subunit epsilon
VLVPGSQGQFEILKDHAPIISTLDKGVVEYGLSKGQKVQLEILGGFVEVQQNVVSLCVEVNE